MGIVLLAEFTMLSAGRHATSWHYFHDAAHALLTPPAGDDDGVDLDLYRQHPEFQFGPIAVLVAAPFAYLPPVIGVPAVIAFASTLGVLAMFFVADAVRTLVPHANPARVRRALLLGGVAFAIVWMEVAIRTLHLDDAIALSATAAGLAAVARRRPWLATVALALAAAAKPWAIVFVPLVLVPPGRHRWVRVVVVGAVVAATWLPFVIDEPATLHATSTFTIRNSPSSALRALGFDDPRTPSWVRPVQFAAGLGVAGWLVWRRRWAGVVMAGLGIRLMIDPAVHNYYAAGLTLGVLVWELLRRPERAPWLAIVTAVLLEVTPRDLQPPGLAGVVRLGITSLVVLLAVVAVGSRAEREASGAGQLDDERAATSG
jgi:hypothetical protein